jgi:hypothetical protein
MLRLSVGALLVAAAAAQTPALGKGVSVQMPVATNAVAVPDADLADALVVAVTFRGTVFLEVTRVTPAQLSEKVKAEFGRHPGKRVYLKGDAHALFDRGGGFERAAHGRGQRAHSVDRSARLDGKLIGATEGTGGASPGARRR